MKHMSPLPKELGKNRRTGLMGPYVRREWRAFARNLQLLTIMHGLTRKQAAEQVGATEVWYRRAATKGLERIDRRSRPILERIVEIFRLTTVEDLWDENLIRFEKAAGISPEVAAEDRSHVLWRQKEWWPWARKLAVILATGNHEYLKEMIDSIYRTVPKDFKAPEPGAAYWASEEIEPQEEERPKKAASRPSEKTHKRIEKMRAKARAANKSGANE